MYICESPDGFVLLSSIIVSGLEAIRKDGTIIRTEIRVRLGQIQPVYRRRSTGAPNICVNLLESHRSWPVCVIINDCVFINY